MHSMHATLRSCSQSQPHPFPAPPCSTLIYKDERYHPWTSMYRFPYFNVTDLSYNLPSETGIGDRWRNGKFKFPPLAARPWHAMEESDDVQRPVFSNCTLPVLFVHHYPFNAAEVRRRWPGRDAGPQACLLSLRLACTRRRLCVAHAVINGASQLCVADP